MRSSASDMPVRLYRLNPDGGGATTLLYGKMAEAMAVAAAQPESIRDELWLQTRDDVVAYPDLEPG